VSLNEKIVTHLPLDELWVGPRLVSTIKVRDLAGNAIREMLRSSSIRFAVADVGRPLQWIPDNETFDFWKTEVKPHPADPEARAVLEQFPDSYCYFASEWKSYDGETIVLLSKAH
jgi:hypothetical protein